MVNRYGSYKSALKKIEESCSISHNILKHKPVTIVLWAFMDSFLYFSWV